MGVSWSRGAKNVDWLLAGKRTSETFRYGVVLTVWLVDSSVIFLRFFRPFGGKQLELDWSVSCSYHIGSSATRINLDVDRNQGVDADIMSN